MFPVGVLLFSNGYHSLCAVSVEWRQSGTLKRIRVVFYEQR